MRHCMSSLRNIVIHLLVSFSSTTVFFFFNDTATTEIYTLSLHDALPICSKIHECPGDSEFVAGGDALAPGLPLQKLPHDRSEEHTSELQSRLHLVCRLLLEKKKTKRQGPSQ